MKNKRNLFSGDQYTLGGRVCLSKGMEMWKCMVV